MTSPALAKTAPRVGAAGPAGAYADARDAVLTPRQGEYRVFARITHRLSEAAVRLREGDRRAHGRLLEAMHDNLRLWLALAVDLADDGNALSAELRAQLISLSGFVERHTSWAVRQGGDAAEAAQPLIDINAAVMKGLRGRPEGD